MLPPDFKLGCDGQKLYANSNIIADNKIENLWLWLMKLMEMGLPIRCFTAKSKFTAVRWCILMRNTSVLVNIQGDERLILNLHLN